jgi:Tol biopolymer transport system component
MKTGVTLAAVVAAIALGASAAQAQTQPRIVFAADRAPTLTGEIFRLDPSGHRVDLSKSPYEDSNPAVSFDGNRVAFISDRSGTPQLYEVGIDGRGLSRVGSALPGLASGGTTLAWQPHGDLLAVATTPVAYPQGHVWMIAPHERPRAVSMFDFALWSPDGRVLLVWNGDEERALMPSGRPLWNVPADGPGGAWSSRDLLAVTDYGGVAVYDEQGHHDFSIAIGAKPSHAVSAWSADGSRLAIAAGTKLEVVTSTGRVVFRGHAPRGDMAWAGDSVVVFGFSGCPACTATRVDIHTGKTSPASSAWLGPRSADGKLAIVTPEQESGFGLGVTTLGTSSTRIYLRLSGCFSDGVWLPAASSEQFAGKSIVYTNWNECDPPFDNLYAAGAGIRRLTDDQAQETQPALSPDGTQIAYVWASGRDMSCKGCSDGIRIANAAGAPTRTLTNPQDCTFDDAPSWSPDGTTILYSESYCDGSTPPELFTIPAAGGTPHDLGVSGEDPAWGPSRIAFVASACKGLCTMNPDGSDLRLVARDGSLPAWSADGRLAYLVGDLYHRSVVVGTSAPVELPFARITWLGWTPDGTRLLVVASTTRLGASDLWSITTDGTKPVRLTKNFGVGSDYFGPGS